MKKGINLLYIIFRDLIMITTFFLAILLENPKKDRFFLITSVFCIFFIWLHLREFFEDKYRGFHAYSFLVDAILLIILDESSKYLVNYYFNVYYFYVLISAGFMLKKKERFFISFTILFAAFFKYYKFFESLFGEPKPENIQFVISYIFFTLMVFITIAVFFNYSRILYEKKNETESLNSELIELNKLLEEKSERIKELTIFEERNRIAREIHDSVGHNLTGLIMNLEFCEKLFSKDPDKTKEQITKAKAISKDCLIEIRRSVRALKPLSSDNLPLINSIKELVRESQEKFNITINLIIDGEIYSTSPMFNLAIYRMCQEGLTNAVRHGKAKNVTIKIQYEKENFSIYMKDDGVGTKEIHLGSGLTGIEERIREFKGDIKFDVDKGFVISATVSKEDIKNEQD